MVGLIHQTDMPIMGMHITNLLCRLKTSIFMLSALCLITVRSNPLILVIHSPHAIRLAEVVSNTPYKMIGFMVLKI